MNKNLPFSAIPASGTRFRNLPAACWRRYLAAIASLLIVSPSLCDAAQSASLSWDASSNPNVAGYKLRYGTTSGNPSQTIDIGKTTTATVSNLNDGTTYYFTATCYTAEGVESQPSNEVSHRTPPPPFGAHLLTVANGSGSGNYTAGTQVVVSASAPASGLEFDTWTEDYQILADPSSSTTTATMPSIDAKVTATYRASADMIRYYPRAGFGERMVGASLKELMETP
jgi:Divergent InlB B-repeat domain/Fibronectin type III domain